MAGMARLLPAGGPEMTGPDDATVHPTVPAGTRTARSTVADPPVTCSIDGCDRRPVARSWCRRHYNQQWKQGLDPLPDTTDRPPHVCDEHDPGSRRCYAIHSCRCHACANANSAYERDRQKQAAYGRPRTVDAADTRQRINELRKAGIGLRTIAADTGLNRGNLRRISEGDSDRVHARVAVVIERYTPDHGRYIAVDQELGGHLAALKTRHTWAELEQVTGISHSTLFNLHKRRAATTVQTRQQILDTPIVCVDCGRPSMAGGLRCSLCFQQQATPAKPTGCGTEAGAAVHRRAGTPVCQPCRQAASRAARLRRPA